jgi:hypothetical protein
MRRALCLLLFSIVLLHLPATTAADGVISGNWKLTTLALTGASETTNWLFKVETKEGATTATLAATSAGLSKGKKAAAPKLVSFANKGDVVRIVVQANGADFTFEGQISKDGKKISGVYGSDASIVPAYLAPTTWTEIETKDVTVITAPKEMVDAVALETSVANLRTKALQTKKQDEKEKILKEMAEAAKTADEEVPALLRKAAASSPPTFATWRAALQLLQRGKTPADPSELQAWAQKAAGDADEFGPTWKAEVNQQIAAALSKRSYAALAVPFAETAEKSLTASAPDALQEKVLLTVAGVLKDAGKLAESTAVRNRLNGVLKKMDEPYLASVPPFKGKAYAGREKDSNRVVVMELFTGAECPPCVASDVAFDVLDKTYKTSELVLIQYHLHIPGPDPMTNPDTEGRAKYYKANSTPSVFFNGTVKAGGGGAMGAGEKKYGDYTKIINRLLEEPATLELSASAKQVNGKVQIQAQVKGLDDAGKDKKLRMVLLEESIRFVGGNKLRFHHQVVRAMAGGPDGFAVTTPNFSKTAEVNLVSLRKDWNLYLDDYAANKRAFPREARPLEFNGLRVIAFVQDDSTKEILQAVQVEVHE